MKKELSQRKISEIIQNLRKKNATPIYLKKKQYKERHANLTEAQLMEKEEEIKNTEIELKIIKNNGLIEKNI